MPPILAYGGLESAGWKSETGTAVSFDNQQGKFYRDLLTRFSRQRRGFVYQYYYDRKLVATDLCISNGTCIVILKTTYDESIKTSSPAMLMRQEAFNNILKTKFYVA